MTDFGYETTKTGFSFGTNLNNMKIYFLVHQFQLIFEDLTTNSKASDNLKKQEGNYFEDFYFNYGLDYDKRNQKFQTI